MVENRQARVREDWEEGKHTTYPVPSLQPYEIHPDLVLEARYSALHSPEDDLRNPGFLVLGSLNCGTQVVPKRSECELVRVADAGVETDMDVLPHSRACTRL